MRCGRLVHGAKKGLKWLAERWLLRRARCRDTGEKADIVATVAPIMFSPWRMAAAKTLIPAADLSNACFDTDVQTPTADVLVLLAAPRSGSTLLCELLRLNAGCIAHEYFQPYQYMQILAQRWGCVNAGFFNEAAYVRALSKHRTLPNGWFGVNVQGTHLKHFARMERHFTDARFHYVHLVRQDEIAQAVSYDIAFRTKQWSSQFDVRSDVEYSFPRILRKLRAIQNQNSIIRSYLLARGASFETITYEDLIADTAGTLRKFGCISPDRELVLTPPLRRQSNDRSAEWKQRFAADILSDQAIDGFDASHFQRLRQTLSLQRLHII